MKKLISLSVIVLTAAVMFGQDTTSTSTNRSQTGSGLDSVPQGRHGDTSALGHGKWADSSKSTSRQDSSMNNGNNNNAGNNNSSDTSGTGGSANNSNDTSASTSRNSSSTTSGRQCGDDE